MTASCGPPASPQAPAASLITFADIKQVHRQRQTVSASVQPPLPPQQFLQMWVRASDNLWYPCEPAKRDSSSGAWNAICQFGSDKHPAPDGAQFVLGAFYTANRVEAEYLPDSVWYLLKTQQTQPVILNKSN